MRNWVRTAHPPAPAPSCRDLHAHPAGLARPPEDKPVSTAPAKTFDPQY
jgi:hypothetical protein